MLKSDSFNEKKHRLIMGVYLLFLFFSVLTINCYFEDIFYNNNNNDLGVYSEREHSINTSGDRLTLINNSVDFLKVDINIYIMEMVNLTFYYTDLATDTTISNLDNKTYFLQKYNNQGEIIERSNGTLFTATDNATILDLKTEFLSLGDYTVLIYFNKMGYVPKNAIITIHIRNRPTLINNLNTIDLIEKAIYEGEIISFNFSYKDKLTGMNLTNLDDKYYLWEKYNEEEILISNGQEDLFPYINDFYILDFHTENKTPGNYIFNVFLQKINYTQKTATINLGIIKREINYVLGNNFVKSGKEYKITVLKGNNAIILINLTDPTRNFIPLEDSSIILTIGGHDYGFEEIEAGIYKHKFLTNSIWAFFEPIPFNGVITITKEGFDPEVIEITIVVEMLEIFPGMPFFYFLNIVVPFFIIISGLILYRSRLNKRKKD